MNKVESRLFLVGAVLVGLLTCLFLGAPKTSANTDALWGGNSPGEVGGYHYHWEKDSLVPDIGDLLVGDYLSGCSGESGTITPHDRSHRDMTGRDNNPLDGYTTKNSSLKRNIGDPDCFPALDRDINCYVIDIIDVEKRNSKTGGYWVLPQYRTRYNSAKQGCSGSIDNSGNNATNTQTECNYDDPISAAKCGIPSSGSGDPTTTINELVKKVVTGLSVIIGISAVIVLMIQGLRMVVSGGDSKAFNSARNGILYAIIGLVLAVFAPAIVGFVLNFFTG